MQAGDRKGKVRTVQLIGLIFLTVSGGPYGLEPLLVYGGQHSALLLLIITPILWDLPTIAAVLELNSMMPVQGGYYQWVKRALGLRWGFYEGWWTWLYTFVDLAIYPILFVEYLGFFFPDIQHYKIPVCLCMIWLSTLLNIWGVVPVGKTALILTILVIIPFLLIIIIALQHHNPFYIPSLSFKGNTYSSIGMGIYTVMWNFIGWDNSTTYAEKVHRPIRTYLISMAWAFLIIWILYFMVVLISQNSGISSSELLNHGYPALGIIIGGRWLGALIALGGMASSLGLYAAVLLSVSRVPKVMADDKLMPAIFNKLHPRFDTPYVSIISCSLVVSVMIFWSFSDLIIIDVTLYGAALILEYISVLALRINAPHEKRAFKIPLPVWGLILVLILPLSVYFIALSSALLGTGNTFKPVIFAIGCLLSAEIIWRIIKWNRNRSVRCS